MYTSYLTIAKTSTDSAWARWCNAVGGIVFLLRPDNYGSTRASITFLSPEKGYEKLSLDDQKKLLISRIQHTGWESERLIKEIEQSRDIYLDRVSQVKANDHATAFRNYETRMRPFAESCQRLPPGVPGLVYPTSRAGVAVLNGFVSLIGSRPVKYVVGLFKQKSSETKSSKSDISKTGSRNANKSQAKSSQSKSSQSKSEFKIPDYD